jgi:hypothetical protein
MAADALASYGHRERTNEVVLKWEVSPLVCHLPPARMTRTRDDDSGGSVDLLVQKLSWLRLLGMARLVPSLLDQAAKDNLTLLDILHRLGDEERASRMTSAIDRCIKDVPRSTPVDGFDFDAPRSLPRAP